MKKSSFRVRLAFPFMAAFFLVLCSASGKAQETASAGLPDAPAMPQNVVSTPAAPQPEPEHTDPQTKRILGIFPNFRAVSVNQHLPPQSVHEKFVTASEDSFDYSAFVIPAVIAIEGEATNATPEFHKGAAGYGRYLWHGLADQTIENYMVEFIVPTVTHEDTRYYTMGPQRGSHSGLKRVGYSMSRIVVTRNDAGKETFNAGEVLGAGGAAGISNLYYPSAERTVGNTLQKWGLNVGIDAAGFMVREFWPDFNHFLFHGHKPMQVPAD